MLKITIFIICILAILIQLKRIDKLKENFVSNLRNHNIMENFESEVPSVRDMEGKKEVKNVDEGNITNNSEYESKINDETADSNVSSASNVSNSNEEVKNSNNTEPENNQSTKCTPKGQDCLFGCPKVESQDVPDKKPKKMNLEEMMSTIEETEKICDMIEEKDKSRKEKEEEEALKKQVELNKRFLIQQKAQNKQIEDLQEIVKTMEFTKEMNETAVEKCGLSADQCLEDKEKKLVALLKKKRDNSKSVKLNVNIDNFSENFMEELRNRLKLNPAELASLMDGIKNGRIDINQLKKQLNGDEPSSGSTYSDNCDKCVVNLEEYIDRCKIPCNKCRHPSWNCPQDRQ